MLALREDSYLKSWQRSVVHPTNSLLRFAANITWGLLERLKPCNEDVGEENEAISPGIVFTEAPQNPSCNELAEGGSAEMDVMAVA